MYGSSLALKKSLLFSFSSFMPLPVSTEAAWILMSKTPVVTSVEGNVIVASHLSNFPAIATEALTENWTLLPSCEIANTGTCAWDGGGSKADAKRQRTKNRIGSLQNVNGAR